jgi:uracil-DNA glycosylase
VPRCGRARPRLIALDLCSCSARTRAPCTCAELAAHPSEAQIVSEGIRDHSARLKAELDTAQPERVVTLGNAALRVFRSLLDSPGGPSKLGSDASYGTPLDVRVGGRTLTWLPLAHPAAPNPYQEAHLRWQAQNRSWASARYHGCMALRVGVGSGAEVR